MPASSRQACSASTMIRSKTLPRWLSSMTPMPLPATFQRSCCACLRTGSGSTPGPAPRLKMRSFIGSPTPSVERGQVHADDVLVAAADRLDRRGIGQTVEMDAGQGRLRAVVDDVLDLFHVDVPVGQHAEHVGQHAGTVL